MNKEILESINSLGKAFSNYITDIVSKFKTIDFKPFLNFIKGIADAFKDIEVSAKRKEVLFERYTSYGKYGWTIPTCSPVVLKRKATSQEQADIYMSKFCSSKEMNKMFIELLSNNKINSLDVNNSIDCYNKKLYKPCVLTLFSIIDGLLISTQGIINKQNRTVNTANKKLKGLTENKNNYLILYLHDQNIVSCIEAVYKSPNDFSVHFAYINRDTVSHGMLKRPVEKIDCKKIFLLLYNILNILSFYKIKEL